jgi:NitT/TauT family transport system substrate-binding protein
LTACVAPPTPTPQRPPLKVGWDLWPGDYPIVIAAELGLFEKHGLRVEPIRYDVTSQKPLDFAGGKLDGAMLVIGDLLPVVTDNNAKVVLVFDNSAGADHIVATPEIAGVADLRGKRIGASIGLFSELFVRQMLAANGLTPDDVTLVDIDPETVPEAIPARIDAGHTWNPHTAKALATGNHVIFSSADTPGLIPDVLAFHTSIAQERPDDIRGFIAAWFEALDYWQANPEAAAQVIAKHTGLEPQEISAEGVKMFSLEDSRHAFERGADTTSLYFTSQLYIDFLVSTGSLTTLPDINQLIDPSFLP